MNFFLCRSVLSSCALHLDQCSLILLSPALHPVNNPANALSKPTFSCLRLSPLLILSQTEPSKEEKETCSHQCPHAPFIKREHHNALGKSHDCPWSTASSSGQLKDSNVSSAEEEEDDGSKSSQGWSSRPVEADVPNLLSEDENFLLPRSSPVISRCSRPVSWSEKGTSTSNPSRYKSKFFFKL